MVTATSAWRCIRSTALRRACPVDRRRPRRSATNSAARQALPRTTRATSSTSLDGAVDASNTNGTAIFAQSLGGTGAGTIAITTNQQIRSGSGSGAAIVIDGGADNTLLVAGSASAVSTLAIVGGAGNESITNTGSVIGDLHLGGGNNRLSDGLVGTDAANRPRQRRAVRQYRRRRRSAHQPAVLRAGRHRVALVSTGVSTGGSMNSYKGSARRPARQPNYGSRAANDKR
ncbi:hypothetical protein KX816_14155 [Sphingosinicellaceae bacterium]|nr:hypothetical protein KX816_14155 [Sphingosinicellaceae bacterium]